MNVLTIFEQRITAIFEEGAPGQRKPFSFKRLAKRAVREMEDETFVIDGVDTAPALYTVLVSSKDDALMRPMYARICDEISQLVEAQAKKRGYTFVGRPLVRFMVDPGLRGGRFSVFAENVDPRTLARLRDEENVYLGITPPRDVPFGQGFVPQPVPIDEEEPSLVSSEVAFVDEVEELGFEPEAVETEPEPVFESDFESVSVPDFIPEPEPVVEPEPVAEPEPVLEPEPVVEPEFVAESEPDERETPAHLATDQFVEDSLDVAFTSEDEIPEIVDEVVEDVQPEPVVSDAIPAVPSFEELEVMPTTRSDEEARIASTAFDEPATRVMPAHRQPDTCTLTDTATGRTYRVFVSRTPIGRERRDGGIVLRDPNASRRHAELLFEQGVWKIRDLNSTNGTLVDDMDVHEAVLANGDVITIGLTNLEFRTE